MKRYPKRELGEIHYINMSETMPDGKYPSPERTAELLRTIISGLHGHALLVRDAYEHGEALPPALLKYEEAYQDAVLLAALVFKNAQQRRNTEPAPDEDIRPNSAGANDQV